MKTQSLTIIDKPKKVLMIFQILLYLEVVITFCYNCVFN